MINLTGTYLTDEVAKDGTRFPIKTLNEIAYHGFSAVPSNISHDLLRPIGWTVANRLLLTSEKSYLLGCTMMPETKAERDKFTKDNRNYIIGKSLDDAKEYKDAFTEGLAKFGIKPSEPFFYNNIALYHEDGIVEKLYPKLFLKKDKDGLILVNEILALFDYKGQGVFADKHSRLAIILHPYFRKSYYILNNYNFSFLEEFFKLQGNKDVRLRVRIDPDDIGYASSQNTALEYEYWYGPTYNDDISNLPSGNTVFKPNPQTEGGQTLYNQIERTDFVFNHRDGDSIFEMEEVTDQESIAIGKDKYGCRYLHSIYKDDKEEFDHFDGAIRIYDLDSIIKRIDTDMDKMGHNTIYKKIFRLDGKISLSVWKLLITLYLHGNHDVYRYFGVEMPNELKVIPKPAPKNHLFCNITSQSGIALLVSYWEKHEQKDPIVFNSYDEFKFTDKTIRLIDYYSLDICKAVKRYGLNITYPADFEILYVPDGIHNIPIISLNNPNIVQTVFKAIKDIIEKTNDKQIFTFTIAFPLEDENVSLSFAGVVEELKKWFKSFVEIPINSKDFKTWIIAQYNYIHRQSSDASTKGFLDMAKANGELYIKREPLEKFCNITDLHLDKDDLKFKGEFVNKDIFERVISGSVGFVQGSISKKEDIESLADGMPYIKSNLIASLKETKIHICNINKLLFFFAKKETT